MAEEISKSEALSVLVSSLSLSGKKTYIVGLLMIVFGGYLSYLGKTEFGGAIILNGLGLMGLRSGVSKSGPEPIANQVADMVAKAIDLQPPCKENTPTQPPAVG